MRARNVRAFPAGELRAAMVSRIKYIYSVYIYLNFLWALHLEQRENRFPDNVALFFILLLLFLSLFYCYTSGNTS